MFRKFTGILLLTAMIQSNAYGQTPKPNATAQAIYTSMAKLNLSSDKIFDDPNPIETVKSSDHKQVPGTNFFMRVPKGFTIAPEFSGVRADKNPLAFVNLNQLPAPIHKICGAFTAEALKAKGMQLQSTQTIVKNGTTSYRFGISQNTPQGFLTKDLRCFGEGDRTYLITGAYPQSEAKDYSEQIKKIVSSVIVDSTIKADFKDTLDHSYSMESSSFKRVAPEVTGAVMFNTEGKIPSSSPLIVYAQSMKVENVNDKMDFALKRLNQVDNFKVEEIKSKQEITLQGLSGIAIEATGTSNKDTLPLKLYQQMLFKKDGYYIFMGTTPSTDEKSFAEIKRIAGTFKLTK